MNVLQYLTQYVMLLLEFIIFFNICTIYLDKIVRSTKLNFIITNVLIMANMITLNLIESNNNFLKFVLYIILMLPYCHYIVEGNFNKKIIAIIISNFVILVFDYIIISIVVGIYQLQAIEILASPDTFILCGLSSKFILLVISYILKRSLSYKQQNAMLNIKEFIFLSIMPATNVLIIHTLIYINMYQNISNIWLVFVACLMIISNVVFLLITQKIEEDKEAIFNNERLKELTKTSLENVQILANEYETQRKLTHDFNNHLSVIGTLICENKIVNAQSYINDITKNIALKTVIILTDNDIVDAILKQKFTLAIEKNIRMDFDINDLSKISMRNEDIVILLSNLLDNAIEACEKCTNNKFIKIKFRHENEETIISIQNSCVTDLSSLKTSKLNKIQHGYGLKNIKSILEKYGAFYTISYENGEFCFSTILVN